MMGQVHSLVPTSTPVDSQRRQLLPPLAQGDRLTRAQFFERYEAMPENVRAERIEGVVYMPAAAVSAEFHGDALANIVGWLSLYAAATPGAIASSDSTTSLDPDNDAQPDASLRLAAGGATRLDEKKYIVGAPELIVEIAASSFSYDLGDKMNVYRRNGVREYIVHRTYDAELDYFILADGQYNRHKSDDQGIFRSEVFPGLWLDARALLTPDMAKVLAVLQQGIASPQHADFLSRLQHQRNAQA